MHIKRIKPVMSYMNYIIYVKKQIIKYIIL